MRDGPLGRLAYREGRRSEEAEALEPLQAPVERHGLRGAPGPVAPGDQTVREVGRRLSEVVQCGQRQVLALDLELCGCQDPLER